MTDATVDLVCKLCSVIQYLDVYGCNTVTINAVKRLIESRHSTLVELNLRDKLREEAVDFLKQLQVDTFKVR